jgi:hypothetical protein
MTKAILAAGVVLAATFSMQMEAVAQSKAPVYRYCLQENPIGRGGLGQTLCRYNTLAQCWASKTSPSDLCYLNPAYPGSRR